jgi:phosphoglycerate kinase
MKKFFSLDDLSPKGKVVLLRADLNVPMQDGFVSDTTRIDRLIPTLEELSLKGARTVILSHFGRPKGRDTGLSLAPVGDVLAKKMKRQIPFVNDCLGSAVEKAIAALRDGDIILLENVRFYPEEEADDKAFADALSHLGQVYVNDAFSCAHRAHATTHGLALRLPPYAGRLMEAELDALEKTLEAPTRPVAAIVGGAKISTKIDLLNNLVKKIDLLVLGGGMANTFLSALDNPVGKSLCERDMKNQALEIMNTAEKHGCQILLPVDAVTATEFKTNPSTEVRSVEGIRENDMMLDIGPETVKSIARALTKMKTVIWNGPLGAFETTPFDRGTQSVAKTVADLTAQSTLLSVAGGGDTVSALSQAGVEDKMTYVSTAGGAFLEWMEGKTLPGVKALQDRAAALRLLNQKAS